MTATPPPGPPPGDPDRIRIGNADRERVVRLLNDAFAEGRLDVHELDERVAKAYAAKTLADLRPLTADLPGGLPAASPSHWPSGPPGPSGPPARPGQPGPPARRGGGFPTAAYRGWVTVVAVNVVIWAVVSAATRQIIYFWPIWVALPLLVGLVVQVVSGGRGPRDRNRERWERRQQRRDRRDE